MKLTSEYLPSGGRASHICGDTVLSRGPCRREQVSKKNAARHEAGMRCSRPRLLKIRLQVHALLRTKTFYVHCRVSRVRVAMMNPFAIAGTKRGV